MTKRNDDVPFSGSVLQMQAKFFSEAFGDSENSERSRGWLDRCKEGTVSAKSQFQWKPDQ